MRHWNKNELTQAPDVPGIHKASEGFGFKFFNRLIYYDKSGFTDISGEPLTSSIMQIFHLYMMNRPAKTAEGSKKLVTFREFPGAGPLFSRFTENTNKIIEQTFSGRLEDLEKKCLHFGGTPENTPSYDVSFRFLSLPDIPVMFHFNDADEILPAKAAFLFYENATHYLDPKSLGIITTYLTGLLVR